MIFLNIGLSLHELELYEESIQMYNKAIEFIYLFMSPVKEHIL